MFVVALDGMIKDSLGIIVFENFNAKITTL